MKKIFTLIAAVLCTFAQMQAEKVQGSQTLPENGRPEHVYTMMNGNNVYVGTTTAPTQTEANFAQFAFYEVDGVSNAYYIYNRSNKKWLTYDKAASYNNGKDFVQFADDKATAAYFQLNNYADDKYEVRPITTAGGTDKYINWYQGVDGNPYDGANTLGLWEQGGSQDNGSSWTFSEVVYVERTYTIVAPEGCKVTIGGTEYANGDQIKVEGSLSKSDVGVTAGDGQFVVVSINDVDNTITVNFATLPTLPEVVPYTNAWVYPKQQDNVGAAQATEENGVFVLSNQVLAAGFMKVGEALYFAGSNAMNLLAGTEPFTVAFGNGDNVPASAMTLKSVQLEDLTGDKSAIGGAAHYDGKQIVAHYEYSYNDAKIAIVWRAILRDGSHYLRTEMDLTGVDNVDMFNVIPMIYNVDTQAAGSTPKTVGNTRGAVLASNKIFAGLETPTAYNTVGEATGEVDPWNLVESKTPVALTANSWQQVPADKVPGRVTEATGASYPNVYAYTMENVALKQGQKIETTVAYTAGTHRLNFGGADLIDATGNIAASDYHKGFSGSQSENNTFTFTAPYDGTFSIRVFVEDASESINASSTLTVNIYEAKEGAEVNTAVVGIQGRWSRNTTLAAGETWKVGAVVGLIAQDGTEANDDIHSTQKRRSFLAYSERERAVPWRAFPCYISWYELNIDRNNAAPGQEHTNFTSDDICNVLNHWKSDFYNKYGEGPAAFIIDDGWDNYGTWTFHKGFPNEMKDMAELAEEMGAGVGAWLGPVGGYGQSGNYRRAYWESNGKMQLSNPAYYQVFKDAAYNLVKNQGDYKFFKFDGISAQFSAVGPDAGDVGNENAEGIIRLERYVREELREDIFFNTTVGTWASPFWYQITDATWRQEADYGEAGNNSIDREKWITYRDRLVHQNYVTNSPLCPINTLMTHGFILTKFGAVSKNMTYEAVLRELRCAFVCGSGMVELYNDYDLMNSINDGKLWEDLAECIAWQKKNADVLPDAHWVGGNPWTGSKQEVYGWASWNGEKATLALRNGSNAAQSYTFTLREALNIPANVKGAIVLNKSFKVQDALNGLTEGEAIDIDQSLTVNLPASTVFAFDGVNADPSQVTFQVVAVSPSKAAEALETLQLTFNADIEGQHDPYNMTSMKFKKEDAVVCGIQTYSTEGAVLTVTLEKQVTDAGNYTLVIPEGLVTRAFDGAAFSGEFDFSVKAPEAIEVVETTPNAPVPAIETITVRFNKEVTGAYDPYSMTAMKFKKGEAVACGVSNYTTEGNLLTVTLAQEVTEPGEYSLVIPEGLITGKALGDAYSGALPFVIEEIDIYEPRNTGAKSNTGRAITAVALTSPSLSESTYELTTEEQGMTYTNATEVAELKAIAGETVTATVSSTGSWVHFYVYIDKAGDGFTASIEEGSNWKPTGDLVAYSFYNNDAASDESGWNSEGTTITGGDRNKPGIPAFTVPTEPGKYRMRFKQDWSNIDPAGDADGKFGDFMANGGQIVDVILNVSVPDGIEGVTTEGNAAKAIYDLSGRKLNEVGKSGVYVLDGKKVIVK